MIDLKGLKFPGARRAYIAANSPNYFLRKLKLDQDVQRFGATYDGGELLEGIESALEMVPQSLDDLVVAYALLAALSVRGPRIKIEEAIAIPAPHHEWFGLLAEKLISSWKSTFVTSVTLSQPSPRFGSIATPSSTTTKLIIPGQPQ